MGRISPLQPTRGLWERRELPQRGPGQSPDQKRIGSLLRVYTLEALILIILYYMFYARNLKRKQNLAHCA